MHVHLIRRHLGTAWTGFRRVAALALVLEALLLCLVVAPRARADTPVAVVTAQAEASYLAARVYAGRTVAGRAAELGFKYPGEVASVKADIGDRVSQGTLLAQLDDADAQARLNQAEADVAVAEANVAALEAEAELARQTEGRFRELRNTGHASAQVYDEQRLALRAKEAHLLVARASLRRAEAARATAEVSLRETRIQAPFDGIVQARYRDEGSQVGAGHPVLRLVEVGRAEAHVGIPESLLAGLREVEAHRLLWQSEGFEARLRTVLPEVDPGTRTLTAIFELDTDAIPLGSVIELELHSRVAEPGYWLPVTALTESDRGLWAVFVVGDDARVERRLVEILHAESDRAYVRGTLHPGDQVVRTGVQRLVPGQRVAPITEWARGT